MAHKETVPSGEVRDWLEVPMFWNVSSSVGYGCPNKEGDVLLVQFFLNSIARIDKRTDQLLVPDGRFGGKTWARIKSFQKARFAPVDGAVSSVSGSELYSPKQGKVYTIFSLNVIYKNFHPVLYKDITMDPKCPVLLTSILSGPMPDLA
ncbi:MAG: peptidoglycan-binding domain-containing protein [Pyrinomonadaceae bacterium]